jgi:putative oxygen-independent coproporphyrinogen III oxidase|tara:strand:+ start:20656 stop:21789 length:1134 start_codon:yes stop_codon:yes gene_type:complete
LIKIDPNKSPLSLYIHFPWCEKKCPYCDFNIEVNKKDGDEELLLKAIIEDLDQSAHYINKRKFASVYFGGGTPSLVSVKIIEQLINKLKNDGLLKKECEINFELNPKEVTKNYLDDLVVAGINRISIGIQSFDQKTLTSLERNHKSEDAFNAISLASNMKSINTTIDLIYGIMDQDLNSLSSDLKIFCDYEIDHLSLYQLTIEPNTIFYKKELRLPSDQLVESMEREAEQILNKNGLFQYEVSSWARDGRKSKHNMNYWMYGDYLGVGPGAHSKITTNDCIKRMIKLKKTSSYIHDPSKTTDTLITSEGYDLDLAMNLLRVKSGLSFDEIRKNNIHIQDSFLEKWQKGVEANLLEDEGLKATDMGYKFLNDTVNIFN